MASICSGGEMGSLAVRHWLKTVREDVPQEFQHLIHHGFDHALAVEWVPWKRRWISRLFPDLKVLLGDAAHLGGDEAWCFKSCKMVVIPWAHSTGLQNDY